MRWFHGGLKGTSKGGSEAGLRGRFLDGSVTGSRIGPKGEFGGSFGGDDVCLGWIPGSIQGRRIAGHWPPKVVKPAQSHRDRGSVLTAGTQLVSSTPCARSREQNLFKTLNMLKALSIFALLSKKLQQQKGAWKPNTIL